MQSSKFVRIRCAITLVSTIIVSSFCLVSSSNAAEPDIARGESLSQTCLGCHGAPGLRNPGPVYQIPMVGGQHSTYIISALQAYKDQTRSHETMQAQAANLTDQDMVDIAAYFNSLGGNTRPSRVNASLAVQGQQESAICATCHGATGDGNPTVEPTPPKLAGQYESYIAESLKGYRSGERNNAVMAGFASTLTIQQIKALSAWYASQAGGLSAPESNIFK